MCWDPDQDGLNSLRQGTRTAAIEHRCANGCRIRPGSVYNFWVFLYEGEFESIKWCHHCDRALKLLGNACRIYDPHSSDPPIPDLMDALVEHIGVDGDGSGEFREYGITDENLIGTLRLELKSLRRRVAAPA